MTNPNFPDNAPQVLMMIQRLIRLRKYFRITSQERMHILADRFRETKKSGIRGENPEPDLLYSVGMVFSRYDGPITMGELSRDLDVPLSKATRIMDWLTKYGYAQRFSDPEDRRIVRVGLTDEGLRMYSALNEVILESSQKILSLFSPEELTTIHQLLEKALDAIEKDQQ